MGGAAGIREIVGSVRARRNYSKIAYVGRLIVSPDLQGHGIGTRLMREIEKAFPGAARFELFTGYRSEGNLRLYQRLGYNEFRQENVTPGLTEDCQSRLLYGANRSVLRYAHPSDAHADAPDEWSERTIIVQDWQPHSG